MNRNQLILLIVIGVVVGGIGYNISRKEQASWTESSAKMGEKLFPNLKVNDVESLSIKSATNTLTLAKKSDIWVVADRSDYPANFSSIQEFMLKLLELKIAQPVKAGAGQLARLELLTPDKGPNGGTLLELKDKSGKEISSILLGKKHMKESGAASPFGGGAWPDGRYIMVGGDAKNVALVSEAFANIEPKAEEWLDKDFLKVEKIRSVNVTGAQATNNWSLSRETENGEWKLAEAKPEEKLDAGKVSSLNYLLSSPTFHDVVSADAKADETGLDHPTTAKIQTFDGFTYAVKLGKATADGKQYLQVAVSADIPTERTPAKDEKAEDKDKLDKEFKDKTQKAQEKLKKEQFFSKWVYQVDKYTVDSLLKERRELLTDKKDETKKDGNAGEAPAAPFPDISK